MHPTPDYSVAPESGFPRNTLFIDNQISIQVKKIQETPARLHKVLVAIDEINLTRVDRATSPLLNVHDGSDLKKMTRTSRRLKMKKPLLIFLIAVFSCLFWLQYYDKLKNTLLNIKNIYWIVVEDAGKPVPIVENLLSRSGIPHSYLAFKTKPGYPRRGWYQRDMALEYLQANADTIIANNRSVLYFADDDNSYDTRLFDEYIRNVKKAGVWAVGLVGGAPVETPVVKDSKVVSWHVSWNPSRKFAVDMAGFAVSVNLIFEHNAHFGTECKQGGGAPETCFLESMKLKLTDLEPFGFEIEKKRELLVWHTQTTQVKYDKRKVDMYGFVIE